MTGQVISSVISGAALLILAGIARGLRGMRGDFRRFMAEHTWLITTTLWTRDKVVRIMRDLDMPMNGEPPEDLPSHRP